MAMSRSRGATALTTRSPMRTSPSVIDSSRASIRSAVVLPERDGPTRTMTSPSTMSSVRSRTASTASKRLWTLAKRTSAIGLSLHGAGEHAPDEVALEEHVDDDDRQSDDDRAGRQQREVRLVASLEEAEAQRRRAQALVADHDQGEQEL